MSNSSTLKKLIEEFASDTEASSTTENKSEVDALYTALIPQETLGDELAEHISNITNLVDTFAQKINK